ncbi:hypothetical protein CKA27_16105 [Vibrio coralliilyticus]|nr:hypothetical protein CKA27_16105 [Vibrio coralliilyticus]
MPQLTEKEYLGVFKQYSGLIEHSNRKTTANNGKMLAVLRSQPQNGRLIQLLNYLSFYQIKVCYNPVTTIS